MPPSASDFACLPSDTPPISSISVPSGTLQQIVSFKPLTLSSGISTTNGADFEATVTWTGGSFSGPSVTIGSGTTVTVSGPVQLAGSVTVTNAGTVQLVDGGSVGVEYTWPNPSTDRWLNAGTVNFADSVGASFSMSNGSTNGQFINQSGATVTKTGSATQDGIKFGTAQNDGSVVSQGGVLLWSPGGGTSSGSFSGNGSGHVQLGGNTAVTAQAVYFGDSVWVVGTLSGTIVVPAGATLNVGDDPSTATPETGSVVSAVAGAGRLNLAGNSSQCCGPAAAADLNVASVTMTHAQLRPKADGTATTIGSGTTVTVSGPVQLAGSVTVTNAGTIQLVDGGSVTTLAGGVLTPCDTPLWLNSGTVAFADTGNGTSFTVGCGGFINQAGGTVVKTGSAVYDSVTGNGQVKNDGTVTSQAGVLAWSGGGGAPIQGDKVSNGTFSGTGGGDVDLGTEYGLNTVSSQTVYYGPSVWVTGPLQGTITVPAGATLNVGYDPLAVGYYFNEGVMQSPVGGQGTLNLAGYSSGYPAVLAAPVTLPTVTITSYTNIQPNSDGSQTLIPSGTTVVMFATPALAPNLVLQNYGILRFQGADYFNCSTCSFTNEPAGYIDLYNADGNFTHSFDVDSGGFVNQGMIRLQGYLPGTRINFSPSISAANQGQAEICNPSTSAPDVCLDLTRPDWAVQMGNSPPVQAAANALQGGLTSLGGTWGNEAPPGFGLAKCANVNLSISAAGASTGVCVVIDSQGGEGVVINVSGSLLTPTPWNLGALFQGIDFSVDAGIEAIWNIDPAGNQSFSVTSGNEPAWCAGGSFEFIVGITGQHCWSPNPGQPYQLSTPPLLQGGGQHSFYAGVSFGFGSSSNFTWALGYSVTVSCTTPGNPPCPPVQLAPPSVSGSPTVGSTLTTTNGSWTLAPSFSWQWQRCTSQDPGSCYPIPGATASTYQAVDADKGSWLSVTVTATDPTSGGSTTSTKAAPLGPVS